MTLHDRIMAIGVQGDRKRADVRADAANLAKEADELMAEMAEALLFCADQLSDENDCARCLDNIAEDSARRVLIDFKNWKERNNEQ